MRDRILFLLLLTPPIVHASEAVDYPDLQQVSTRNLLLKRQLPSYQVSGRPDRAQHFRRP